MEHQIREQSGKRRENKEALFDYWQRALGWNSLAAHQTVLRKISNTLIAAPDPLLLQLAKSDPIPKVRENAIRSLTEMKSYDVLPVLQALIQSPNTSDKWTALHNLQRWRSNPDALDILEPYRNDSLIGRQVTQNLEKYAR